MNDLQRANADIGLGVVVIGIVLILGILLGVWLSPA